MMNRVRWLVLVLMVLPLLAGCDPVVQIRVVSEANLTGTVPAAESVTTTTETPTAIPDTPAATASPSPTVIPATAEATATPSPTAIPATPQATATTPPSPTAPRPPTPTRPPATATPDPHFGATRIRFQEGATSATVSGLLGQHDASLYVLWAAAGQVMEVAVASPQSGLSFAIWGEDGNVLKAHAEERAECVLPTSQDYFVELYSGEQAASYNLTARVSARDQAEVIRIRFEQGATSAAQEGRLEPGDCAHYVLRALAGQSLEAQVSPGEVVGLEVRGPDGSLWSSDAGGSLTIEQLPQPGDYTFSLCTPSWTGATDYTLEITIPPR